MNPGQPKWERFLEDIQAATLVTLVGPFYGKTYQPTSPTIFVDGGTQFRPAIETDNYAVISVGDGDSTDLPLDKVLPQAKDYSDLAYILRHIPDSVRHVDLVGFLGGRRDHELLNFGAVHHFLYGANSFRSARFDDLVVAFVGGKISQEIHGTFSTVVFEAAAFTITGSCTYTVEKPLPLREVSSHGLSNMGFGTVFVECSGPCFLFMG